MSSRPARTPPRADRSPAPGAAPAATALAAALALSAWVFTPVRHLGQLTLPKQTLLQLAVCAALPWIALDAERRARCRMLFRDPDTRWLALATFAWLAWSGASLAWSPSVHAGWPVWYGWLVDAGVATAIATLCTTPGDRARVTGALVLGGVGVAALGIAQYLTGADWVPQTSPPAASFGNRNLGAEVVVLALPFALLRSLVARTPRGGVVALAAWTTMGVYLLYVSSTAAWIATAVATACLLACALAPRLRGRAFRFDAARVTGVSVGLLLVLALGGLDPGAPIVSKRSPAEELSELRSSVQELGRQGSEGIRASSIQGRLYAFRNTLPMLRDHPLGGVGLGGWRVTFPRYAWRDHSTAAIHGGRQPEYAHDDYLQLVAECGLVGGLLLLGVLVGLARASRAALRRAVSGEERLLACAGLASLVALGVSAAAAYPLYGVVPPAWAGAVVGVLAGLALPVSAPEGPRGEPAWRRASAVGVAIALALAGLAAAIDAWRYDLALSRVMTLIEGGREAEALDAATPLLARGRDDPILLSRVGDLYLENRSPGGLPLFERIEGFDPWNAANLMSLARSHFHAGRTEQAIAYARRALEIAPTCEWCRRFLENRERQLGAGGATPAPPARR